MSMATAHEQIQTWRERDRQSRERLREVAARAGSGDTIQAQPSGWTVAAMLAHIGVWDSLTAARWREAREAGQVVPDELPQGIVDFVNAGTLPLLATLPIEGGVAFAERGAAELAGVLDSLPEEALLEAQRLGRENLVDRSDHRTEHLDEIEAALRGSSSTP
jgi:hypothetical protein